MAKEKLNKKRIHKEIRYVKSERRFSMKYEVDERYESL